MARIDSDTVAAEVRANLARRGETRAWLCDTAGIKPATMSRRLAGKSPFTVDELAAIAEALEIPLSALLPGVAA